MSAEIASVPSWKVALMERKRRQDKESSTGGCCSTTYGRSENCENMTGVPTWKRDMLVKKQQAKNTFVFVARSSTQQPSTESQSEASFGTHADSNSVLTNGRVTSSVRISDQDHHESDACQKQQNFSEDTTGPVIDFDASDIQLLEERLLPIQANPILRLDLEKRQHASVHTATARISSGGSSRPSSTMVNGNGTRISMVEDQSCAYHNGLQSTADIENEDVFGEGGTIEDEVQYGKGFVHKLLMKFSHLSSNEHATTSRNQGVKSRHSSSGETSHSTSTSPRINPPLPPADSENLISSKGISRVKFHSVDDLLSELHFMPAKSDEDGECESGRNVMNGDCAVRHPSPELLSVRPGEKVDDEVLPLANIVSNTRSLFERLVTSPVSPAPAISPKPPALHASSSKSNNNNTANIPNNRFSFGQPVERRKENEKRLSAGPTFLAVTLQEVNQPRPQTASSAPGFAVDPTCAKQETDKNMNSIVATVSSGSLPPASLPTNTGTTVVVVRNNYPGSNRDVVNHKLTNEDESTSKLNSDKNSSTVNERISANADVQKIFSQIDLNDLPLKPSDVANSSATPLMNGTSKKIYGSKSNGVENEPTPVASSRVEVYVPEKKPDVFQETTAVAAEKSSLVSKPGGFVGSNQRSGVVNEKQNSVSSSTVISKVDPVVKKTTPAANTPTVTEKSVTKNNNASSSQKNNASRPGMLLIRPASNLVAAKTKSEYLDLTKYNDVRKGEFAPAAKKPVNATRAEEDGGDEADGVDGSDVEQPDSAAGKVMFSGAGISLGRSLLSKTKQGRQLQINFDDATTRTFEYPSEQSLMDATPATPGYVDYEGEDVPDYSAGGSSGLLVTPSIVAAGALSSYRSRTQVDYQFGMHVTDEKKETAPAKPPNKTPPTQTQLPTENESASWSKGSSSSDLLF